MRISSSITSVSWIPSEAITGAMKLPFALGMTHWDDPLPDVIDDLEALRTADRFRFANVLGAWVEVEDGRIVASGFEGGGRIGSTTVRLGPAAMRFAAVAFPDLRRAPEATADRVRFEQTAGGRTGAPMPRRVDRPPYVRISAPTAWTTLALTIHADGRVEHEVVGASPFPRHWIYDADGHLVQKTGFVDFRSWAASNFGERTPWGDHEETARVTEVESALERELSVTLMRGGARPEQRTLPQDALLTEQGAPGDEVYLLLDGILSVEVDGTPLAEVGPGAILGERAVLESGVRTSTLRAVTPARVAVAHADQLDHGALAQVAEGHRREEVGTA
jgi:hypothetical protein